MKIRSLEFSVRTNKKGQMIIDQPTEFNDFLKRYRNRKFNCVFEVKDENPSKALIGYYYKVVVPKFQKAFFDKGTRMTLQKTEEEIRKLSPIIWREYYNESGSFQSELKKIEQLDSYDQVLFLEHIKQIAIEDFSVFIEDPIYI